MDKLKHRIFIIAVLVMLSLGSAPALMANTIGGWFDYFNVYSTGNIEYYHSDFQGVAGAQGDFKAGNFQLNDMGAVTPYSLYAGGNVDIQAATIWNGGISAGGSVSIQNSWIQQGNVVAGGNITLDQATIGQNDAGGVKPGGVVAGGNASLTHFYVNGDVIASGTATFSSGTVQGSVQAPSPSPPVTPPINLSEVTAYFKTASRNIGSHAPDIFLSSYLNNALSLSLHSGDNYFTMTNEEFRDIWGAYVSGPSDAKLFINVMNEDREKVEFDWVEWYLSGGMSLSNILVNFPNAQEVFFTQGSNVDLLMPFAATRFDAGLVTGNLVTGDLYGGYWDNETTPGGQVNLRASVPEPATFVLVGLGMLAVAALRRKNMG